MTLRLSNPGASALNYALALNSAADYGNVNTQLRSDISSAVTIWGSQRAWFAGRNDEGAPTAEVQEHVLTLVRELYTNVVAPARQQVYVAPEARLSDADMQQRHSGVVTVFERPFRVFTDEQVNSLSVSAPLFAVRMPDFEQVADDPDIVATPLTGLAQGFTELRPAERLLEGLPATVRANAVRIVPTSGAPESREILMDDDGTNIRWGDAAASDPGVTAAELIDGARRIWRASVQQRMRSVDAEAESARQAQIAEHRSRTARSFAAFARRPIDEAEHVGTLPFVPHGLASSRRWGIEVESGGARGVDAPDGWRAVGDSSLRSAYQDWVEVQDFEPYDEEVTRHISPDDCENWERHEMDEQYSEDHDTYITVPVERYIDPRECDSCGRVTRVEHRVPQTVTHRAQVGDCREFVSPILVSMHSRGLEQLCEQLSVRPQNDSAGVHVHVEASDLTSKEIATLVFGYDILEPILEKSYRRESRRYCGRREASDVLAAARMVRVGADDFDAHSGSRYVTLNTHSLSEHGTIEFRAMGAVYDYAYLTRWAMLCRELVNLVAAGVTTKQFSQVRTWQDLLNLLAAHGKEYIRASVYELTGEVGEVARLEKEGVAVTASALNSDLQNITNAFEELSLSVTEAQAAIYRSLSAAMMPRAVATAGEPWHITVEPRLVTVGGDEI